MNTCEGYVSRHKELQHERKSGPHNCNSVSSNSTNFTSRPSKEVVRNCSSVNKDIKTFIVDTVAHAVLHCNEMDSDGIDIKETGASTWRQGGLCCLAS